MTPDSYWTPAGQYTVHSDIHILNRNWFAAVLEQRPNNFQAAKHYYTMNSWFLLLQKEYLRQNTAWEKVFFPQKES